MIQGHRSWLKFKILKWCLATFGVVISIYISLTYYQSQKFRIENYNKLQAERAIARFESRIKIYETLLTQTQAFFVTLKKVDFDSFHQYYFNLKNLSRFHGFLGLGFTRYVPQSQLSSFIKDIKKEIPSFEIWPAEKKDEHYPVTYLEPQDYFSQTVIGFDQASESERKSAFNRSLLTGETTMTRKIAFVRERGKSTEPSGFLLVRPIYKNNQELTPGDKENLIGFIFAPFVYQDIFSKAWEDFTNEFSFRVYQDTGLKSSALLFSSSDVFAQEDAIKNQISLYGQEFQIFSLPKEKDQGHIEVSFIILAVGLSITLLVLKILSDTIKRAEQSSINERFLEESLKSRDEFISIASHELKTPLTSLKLRAQLSKRKLQNNKASDKDLREFSTEIEKQVIRLERLVNDILDFSRIRTDNFSLSPEEFDLVNLVEEVISRMGSQFTSQTYPMVIIPKRSLMVCWDKLRMEQVLINLLTNAIKYGKDSPITVEVQDKKDEIIISVKDRGIGIPDEFRETIFNRFERAGISPNEISGLGLGLYITFKIVTSHQGKIWVESALREGSTFYIKIPKYPHF